MTPEVDGVALYAQLRGEVIELYGRLDDADLRRSVPATPEWTVHDVLAHVVGLTADLNAQRFPAPDDHDGSLWTAAQIERRHALSVADLVAEWNREAPAFVEGLRLFDEGAHYLADLHAHAQDVHQALGLPPLRADAYVSVALVHFLPLVDEALTDASVAAELVFGGDRRVVGAGAPVATLTAEPFELLRVASYRRSRTQIEALAWTGDSAPVIDAIDGHGDAAYRLPTTDVTD